MSPEIVDIPGKYVYWNPTSVSGPPFVREGPHATVFRSHVRILPAGVTRNRGSFVTGDVNSARGHLPYEVLPRRNRNRSSGTDKEIRYQH